MREKALFVDTTIQVDRLLEEHNPTRIDAINGMLQAHDFIMACTYSRLEYKRVVIQNLALCLRYLVEEKSFWLALKRANRVGAHRPRKASTLTNILAWLGDSLEDKVVEAGDEDDRKLEMRAESYIRNSIIFLWKRFDKSVDHVANGTGCARANEPPFRRPNGSIDATIPESLCQNGQCDNVNFFLSHRPQMQDLCSKLDKIEAQGVVLTNELKNARDELRKAMKDRMRLFNYDNCLSIGDVWIHVECVASGIKQFGTTNYKESKHLCPALGLTMVQP